MHRFNVIVEMPILLKLVSKSKVVSVNIPSRLFHGLVQAEFRIIMENQIVLRKSAEQDGRTLQ